MRLYEKVIKGLEMEGYNDSNVEWVIQSKDKDGTPRTERYDKRKFGLKESFHLHARLYSEI